MSTAIKAAAVSTLTSSMGGGKLGGREEGKEGGRKGGPALTRVVCHEHRHQGRPRPSTPLPAAWAEGNSEAGREGGRKCLNFACAHLVVVSIRTRNPLHSFTPPPSLSFPSSPLPSTRPGRPPSPSPRLHAHRPLGPLLPPVLPPFLLPAPSPE